MSVQFSRLVTGSATAAVAVAVVLSAAAGTAVAKPDAGSPVPPDRTSSSCPLQRVGTQSVRCDDLTGNGVAAPSFIPSR